jgi:hypothetical protein
MTETERAIKISQNMIKTEKKINALNRRIAALEGAPTNILDKNIRRNPIYL